MTTLRLSDKSTLARHANPEEILAEALAFATKREITKVAIFMIGPNEIDESDDATKKMAAGFGTKDEFAGFLQRMIFLEVSGGWDVEKGAE